MSEDRRALDVFFGIVVLLLSPLAILMSPFWLAYKAFRTVIGLPIVEEKLTQKHHQQLYEAAKQRTILSEQEFVRATLDPIDEIPEPLVDPIIDMIIDFYNSENMKIPPPPPVANSLEGARYRDLLAKAPDLNRAAAVLTDLIRHYLSLLPDQHNSGEMSFPGSVADVIASPALEPLCVSFFREEVVAAGLYTYTRRQLERNLHDVSKLPFTLENRDSPKLVLPRDYKGDNAAYDYLKNTPLLRLFKAEYPFSIPDRARLEHTFIIGGSGHGKTTLLEHMLLHDLNDERQPAIVVVDSQGQLIDKISHSIPALLRDTIIIDPRDNPALNMFDINQRRLSHYSRSEREQVYNQTLETFTYLFNSLLGAQLSVRQTTLFSNLIHLMLALPEALGRNATLHDLIKVMDKTIPPAYLPALKKLDPIARDFLTKDFATPRYDQTKEEIRYRIQNILSNKTLARLFLAPNNTIDFHEELNKGSVILIDTTQAFLGRTNSSYLGRIAITIILNAIMERASTPGPHRPVYLFIDEAQEYFDKGIDTFLAQARKYRAGLVLATQDLSHVPTELRSSIFSNTSIKFAGGMSSADARALAADMRSEPEFLLSQRKLNFACYVRNHTPKARAVHVEVGRFAEDERLEGDAYQSFRERNRKRVAAPELLPAPTEEDDSEAAEPDGETVAASQASPKSRKPAKPKPVAEPDPGAAATDW